MTTIETVVTLIIIAAAFLGAFTRLSPVAATAIVLFFSAGAWASAELVSAL